MVQKNAEEGKAELTFHKVHGTAIQLRENNTVAIRRHDFCNGIIFSSLPLVRNQRFCIQLTRSSEFSAALRLGVTSHDPFSIGPLPRYACPDLTCKAGFWARPISELQAETGHRLTFYVNSAGQLHYFINNEHKGVLIDGLPREKSLWVMIDLYGGSTGVQVTPADEAPVEILARGRDALEAYQRACESGTQPSFRTRLMIVGQKGVGKTSLKKALMGQSHDSNELSTEGIDLSSSCSFNSEQQEIWRLATRQEALESGAKTSDQHDQNEEYYRVIASNIVHDLQHQAKLREEKERKEERDKSLAEGRVLPHEASSDTTTTTSKEKRKKFSSVTSESAQEELERLGNIQEIPERVVQLVEEFIEHGSGNVEDMSTCGNDVTLDIWDYTGDTSFYPIHQIFLSTRAVYVVVFDLREEISTGNFTYTHNTDAMSALQYMDFWLMSVHLHVAQNTRNTAENVTLSPPILIVGTHKHALSPRDDEQQQIADQKFQIIRSYVTTRPYAKHVIDSYYAVENSLADDAQFIRLRHKLQEVASREPYMGEQIPFRWLKVEHYLHQMVKEDDTCSCRVEQIREVARDVGVLGNEELSTMLQFYHDLGVIVLPQRLQHLQQGVTAGAVILQPQWLIGLLKQVLCDTTASQPTLFRLMETLHDTGLMEERLLDALLKDMKVYKDTVLAIMDEYDLAVCKGHSKTVTDKLSAALGRSFYVPSRIRPHPSSPRLYVPSARDVTFYLLFNDFLPESIYNRMVLRAARNATGGHDPQLTFRCSKFFLDHEHDFVMELNSNVITVVISRILDADESDSSLDSGDELLPPRPQAVSKVRHFLESAMVEIKEKSMKRLFYRISVACFCERTCSAHRRPRCQENECLHYLSLNECLANKVIMCGHRRIKTSVFRKWFPTPSPAGKDDPVLPPSVTKDCDWFGNIESKKGSELPTWLKGAAKLLNCGCDGQDWTTLAKKLGYAKNRLEKVQDDLNPSLALLTDFIISRKNTRQSLDDLVACLDQMRRDDIIDVITKGQDEEPLPCQVFISYQWDSQDEIRALRERLERAGFSCWMDVGQMGGGDVLNTKIDEGIRGAKVFVCCLTPRYVTSQLCNRELSLADLLHKPLIPIMYERVPWPPPGAMSLPLCQLLYVDMKGVGGHGGSGLHADLEQRYHEIVQRITSHVEPQAPPTVPPPQQQMSITETRTDNEENRLISSVEPVSPHSDAPILPLVPPTPESPIPFQQWDDLFASRQFPSQGDLDRPRRLSRTQSSGEQPVEQVHVTRCVVCTIL